MRFGEDNTVTLTMQNKLFGSPIEVWSNSNKSINNKHFASKIGDIVLATSHCATGKSKVMSELIGRLMKSSTKHRWAYELGLKNEDDD